LCILSTSLKTGDIHREKHVSLHRCNVKSTAVKSSLSNLSAVLRSQAQAEDLLFQSSWLSFQDNSRFISMRVLPENGKSGVAHTGTRFLMPNPAKHSDAI